MKTRDTIIHIIEDQLGATEVTEEARLVEDLAADSLDIMEIVFAIEDAMHIRLDDNQLDSINTVGELVKFVEGSV